ncbi:hypothetical protein GLAREA_01318 [Glarea lozoyensis ATCC 20868]|uniref:Uncharacterized protein n=1 Tax=Glarea lozoyensis (strain ATCC 20868 / MF5171) TaxID=1116229 RepID=S3D018_GLAL2|nr:uncharacterized protein GLAREA_01318 [Glarea lozoyensis ATCC 20868]EPE25406.1 hypothetical protein GLAREA_01318 [Glarea lozoyensis ATCC 20868]
MTQQKPTYTLCTVNKVPARAKVLIGRFIEEQKEECSISYLANCERIEEVQSMLLKHNPDILFIASMWTPTESTEIMRIARETNPGIKGLAIPFGLQVEKGPDAVVEFLGRGGGVG